MLKKAFSPRGVDGVDEPAGSSSGVAVDPQDVKVVRETPPEGNGDLPRPVF